MLRGDNCVSECKISVDKQPRGRCSGIEDFSEVTEGFSEATEDFSEVIEGFSKVIEGTDGSADVDKDGTDNSAAEIGSSIFSDGLTVSSIKENLK